MRTVYYLTHRDSDRRLRYYSTLAGARIAQRQRNHRLGFHTRIERIQLDHYEYERCVDSDDQIVDATWVIEEAVIDSPDLTIEAQ
jgi:hypothetical protein